MRQPVVRIVIVLATALAPWLPMPGLALDHDNLDPNRPIGMEDAYAIAKGEIGAEGGVRVNDRREGRTRVTYQPQIIYGAFANTQIEIQGDLMNEPNSLVGAPPSPATCTSACSIISTPRPSTCRPSPCGSRRTCRPA